MDTSLSDSIGWEGSLIGEAAWMKSHWMPLLKEERAILGGAEAHHVVQVDIPDLAVYNSKSGQGWSDVLHHFGRDGEDAEALAGSPTCIGVLAGNDKAYDE